MSLVYVYLNVINLYLPSFLTKAILYFLIKLTILVLNLLVIGYRLFAEITVDNFELCYT